MVLTANQKLYLRVSDPMTDQQKLPNLKNRGKNNEKE